MNSIKLVKCIHSDRSFVTPPRYIELPDRSLVIPPKCIQLPADNKTVHRTMRSKVNIERQKKRSELTSRERFRSKSHLLIQAGCTDNAAGSLRSGRPVCFNPSFKSTIRSSFKLTPRLHPRTSNAVLGKATSVGLQDIMPRLLRVLIGRAASHGTLGSLNERFWLASGPGRALHQQDIKSLAGNGLIIEGTHLSQLATQQHQDRRKHTHTHTRARARTHARTHIHARTHARTHAHAHTHTHTNLSLIHI